MNLFYSQRNKMYIYLVLVFNLLHYISSSKNCIISQTNSSECLECNPGFYRASLEYKYQPFAQDDCVPKSNETKPKLRVLISDLPCLSCSGLFDYFYVDLETALIDSRKWTFPYYTSVFEIFLSNQIHNITRKFNDNLVFYKNDAVNLRISPLYCNDFPSITEKICFLSQEAKALIKLRKQTLHIFVIGELKLISLNFDAIDSHMADDGASCLTDKDSYCCDEISLGSIKDPACSVRSWSLIKKGEATSSNGPLIQVQKQDFYYSTPFLFIYNCVFSNFQTKWLDVGFDSLIKVSQACGIFLHLHSVAIRNCYFWGGIIAYYEQLGGLDSCSILSDRQVRFTNSEIVQYNSYMISDQDFNTLPSVFDFKLANTFFILENTNFTNITLVSHKTGGETLLTVRYKPNLSRTIIRKVFCEQISSKGSLLNVEKIEIFIESFSIKNSTFTTNFMNLNSGIYFIAYNFNISEFYLEASSYLFNLADLNKLIIHKFRLNNSACNLFNARYSNLLIAGGSINFITFYTNFIHLEKSNFSLIAADLRYLFSPKSIIDTTDVNNIIFHNNNLTYLSTNTIVRTSYFSLFMFTSLSFVNNTDVLSFFGVGDVFKSLFLANSEFINCKFYQMFGVFLGNPPMLKYFFLMNVKMHNITFTGGWMMGLYLVFLKISECSFYKIVQNSVGVILNIISVVLYSVLVMTKTTITECGFTKEPDYLGFIADYTIFFLYQATMALIDNCTFIQGNMTSLVSGFISASFIDQSLTISNNRFNVSSKNSKLSYMGVLMQGAATAYFINNIVSDLECPVNKLMFISTYHRNGVISLRAFGLEQSQNNSKKAFVIGNQFINCRCQQGGSLFIENYRYLSIFRNSFYNSTATEEKGGHIMILGADFVDFKLNSLKSSKSLGQGGAIYLDSVLKITINDSNLTTCFSSKEGGCLYLKDVGEAYMTNNLVEYSSAAASGGFLYLESSDMNIKVITINHSTAGISGGSIGASFNSRISVLEGKIFYSYANDFGGFLLAESPALVAVVMVTIMYAKSGVGGILYLAEVVDLHLESVSVTNSETRSGIIFWNSQTTEENLASYYIYNITCESNIASIGTCMYLRVGYEVVKTELIIVKNCSDGIALYSYPQRNINIVIQNLTISESTSQSALIFFRDLNFSVIGANFSNNRLGAALFSVQLIQSMYVHNASLSNNKKMYAIGDVSTIVCESSNIELVNFTQISKTAMLNEISLLDAVDTKITLRLVTQITYTGPTNPLISLESGEIIINDCMFSLIQPLVLSAKYSNVIIERTIFEKNGFISIESSINISENSKPSVIDVIGSLTEEFHLDSTEFREITGLGVSCQETRLVHFDNLRFVSNGLGKTSATKLTGILSISIEGSEFKNLSSNYLGGAIFIYINPAMDSFSSISITNSSFIHNAASQGGAIFISNAGNGKILIKDNNFTEQEAWIGGVVFFNADNKVSGYSIYVTRNYFERNIGTLHSPTIYSLIPFEESENIFNKNTDNVNMTETLAGLPIKVLFVDIERNLKIPLNIMQTDYEAETFLNKSLGEANEANILSGNTTEENFIAVVTSGKQIKLSFIMSDSRGNQLVFEEGSSVSIEPLYVEYFKENNKINLENAFNKTSRGKVDFNELFIRGKVNSYYVLQMKIKIANEKFYASKKSLEINVFLKIKIEYCEMGQLLSNDYTCSKCGKDYYSNIDPLKDIHPGEYNCKICPSDAVCPGGALIYPKSGFWRFGNESTQIIECFKDEACVGPVEGSSAVELEKGVCAKGHRGHLCHFCDPNYGKITSESLCYLCDEISEIVSTFFLLASAGIIIYSVSNAFLFSSMSSKNKILARETTILGVLIKIAMDFGQQISIVSNLNPKIPTISFINSLLKNMKFMAVTIEDLILNECYLRVFASQDEDMIMMRFRLIGIIPLFYCVLNGLFLLFFLLIWKRIQTCKGRELGQSWKEFFTNYLIKLAICSAITIDLFIPMIVDSGFFAFNCLKIIEKDQKGVDSYSEPAVINNYLYINPNILCWDSYHYSLIYKIIMPVLLSWGCFYPFLVFLILKSNSEKTTPVVENSHNIRQVSLISARKQPGSSHFKEVATKEKIVTELNATNAQAIATQQNESTQELNMDANKTDNNLDPGWVSKKISVISTRKQNYFEAGENQVGGGYYENNSPLTESYNSRSIRSSTYRMSGLQGIKIRSRQLWNAIHTTFHENSILAFYHEGYRKEYIYWECVITLKNVLIRFFFSMRFVWGNMFSFFSMTIIYTYFLGINIRVRPYIFGILNQIKILSVEINMVIFLGMMILSADNSSQRWREFASVICFLILLAFFTMLIYYMALSMKKILSEKKKNLMAKIK